MNEIMAPQEYLLAKKLLKEYDTAVTKGDKLLTFQMVMKLSHSVNKLATYALEDATCTK